MTDLRLAKLTRPRTEGLLRRERLFEQLDQARRRPSVWINAPPGAGKTSLLASYLDTRGLPALWYQMDSGDADPATFFHYLTICAGGLLGRKARPLPSFSQELAAEAVAHGRRLFRALCMALPPDAVLVLDNYQEVSERSQFTAVMQAALEEIPAGICVVCLSRAEAPVEFSRLRMAQRMSVLDFDTLKLTLEEARRIVSGDLRLDDDTLRTVYEQTHGWAAGLVLVAERLRQTGQIHQPTSSTNLETVFDYFAGQIFNALPAPTQDMLIRLSYLPRLVGETAEAITGEPDATRLLENLARRNLFTDRRYGEDVSYQFHALFRAFLQLQAHARLGASEHRKTAHSAAALLQATGQVEDAFSLYAATGAWGSAAALIQKEAERLIRQGRRQTLRRWITALPINRVDETLWLQYWLGICTLGINQDKARELLTSSFEGFNSEANLEGQLSAAIAATNVFFALRTGWSGLAVWIDRLLSLQSSDLPNVSSTMRIRSAIALGRAMLFHQPEREDLWPLIEILRGHMHDVDLDPDERVAAGAVVLGQHWIHGRAEVCDETIEAMREIFASPHVSAASRAMLYVWWIYVHALRGQYREAGALVDMAKQDHDELALSPIGIEFERIGTAARIMQGDFSGARRILENAVAPHLVEARIAAKAHYRIYMGLCLLGEGDVPGARRYLDEGLELFRAHRYVLAEVMNRHLLGLLLASDGRFEQAHALLIEHGERARRWGSRMLEGVCHLCRAQVFLSQGDENAALGMTREGFAPLAGSERAVASLAVALLGDLLAFALAHGVGAHWLPDFIRQRGFRCRRVDLETWPWPIKARTLGALDLRRGGSGNAERIKGQHRLLDLFKALVAHGREGASSEALAHILWPDSEGDGAHNALQVSLFRLRKLLGRDDAIRVQDGKVSIDRQVCWVDAWAFENKVEQARCLSAGNPNFEALARTAVGLYRGHLLAREKDRPWMLAPRERLRRHWP